MKIPPELQAAWANVRDDMSTANWVICEPNRSCTEALLTAKGKTGWADFTSHFTDDKILFGGYRCRAVDAAKKVSAKFIFVNWQGKKVSAVRRGMAGTLQEEFRQLFSGIHISIQTNDKGDFNLKDVETLVQSGPRAHRPTRYEFDGNEGIDGLVDKDDGAVVGSSSADAAPTPRPTKNSSDARVSQSVTVIDKAADDTPPPRAVTPPPAAKTPPAPRDRAASTPPGPGAVPCGGVRQLARAFEAGDVAPSGVAAPRPRASTVRTAGPLGEEKPEQAKEEESKEKKKDKRKDEKQEAKKERKGNKLDVPTGAAPPEAAEASPEEMRLAADGKFYTKQEFIDYYGGTAEWDAAGAFAAGHPAAAPRPPTPRSAPSTPRTTESYQVKDDTIGAQWWSKDPRTKRNVQYLPDALEEAYQAGQGTACVDVWAGNGFIRATVLFHEMAQYTDHGKRTCWRENPHQVRTRVAVELRSKEQALADMQAVLQEMIQLTDDTKFQNDAMFTIERERLQQAEAGLAARDKEIEDKRLALDTLHKAYGPPDHWTGAPGCSQGWRACRVTEKAVFDALSGALLQTRAEELGRGRDAVASGYSKLALQRVWRIQNPTLWKRYAVEREAVAVGLKHGRLNKQTLELRQETADTLGPGETALPDDLHHDGGVNEVRLFHGTSADALPWLLRDGLNERFSTVAMFGHGVYFGEDPGKSDQYAKSHSPGSAPDLEPHLYPADDPQPGAVCYMLVCRVVCGDYAVTRDGRTLTAGGDLWAKRDRELARSAAGGHYTSLLVDTGYHVARYREFVLFHGQRAYPEYLLAYTRE